MNPCRVTIDAKKNHTFKTGDEFCGKVGDLTRESVGTHSLSAGLMWPPEDLQPWWPRPVFHLDH